MLEKNISHLIFSSSRMSVNIKGYFADLVDKELRPPDTEDSCFVDKLFSVPLAPVVHVFLPSQTHLGPVLLREFSISWISLHYLASLNLTKAIQLSVHTKQVIKSVNQLRFS